MFKSIWSILGVFMIIPILIINHAIPDSMMEKETRHIVVLILLTIQINSVIIQVVKTKRNLKKLEKELEQEKKDWYLRIKNMREN